MLTVVHDLSFTILTLLVSLLLLKLSFLHAIFSSGGRAQLPGFKGCVHVDWETDKVLVTALAVRAELDATVVWQVAVRRQKEDWLDGTLVRWCVGVLERSSRRVQTHERGAV